jgi:hypothetical protein
MRRENRCADVNAGFTKPLGVPPKHFTFCVDGWTRRRRASASQKLMWHRENSPGRINVTRKLNVYQASRGIERAQAQG